MKFSALNLRPLRTGAVVVTTLVATSWALGPLERPAWAAVREREPALKLESLQGALGQGVTVGLLGGFRSIVADMFWIKFGALWEASDLPATQTALRLVTTIDPRPLYFWLNGVRAISREGPFWRVAAEGGPEAVSKERQHAIDLEQAEVGLGLLDDALTYHPKSWAIYLEMAFIHLNHTGDIAKAAAFYRLAAEQPGAPDYAARIHGKLLIDIGHYQEAYDWSVKLYARMPKPPGTPGSKLPPTNQPPTLQEELDAGEAALILERIRDLEKKLHIPPEKAFQP